MTDYRARILATLQRAYRDTVDPDSLIHDAAANAILEIAKDATREVSEQVARLKLADADRAARELGVGDVPPGGALINGRAWTQAVDDLPEGYKRWLFGGVLPTRPSPGAVSTPTPVPASDDARQGVGEAHSGSQGAQGFAVGDTVERIQVNGAPWYRGEVLVAAEAGLQVRVTAMLGGLDFPATGAIQAAPFATYGKPCWRKVGGSQGSEVDRG